MNEFLSNIWHSITLFTWIEWLIIMSLFGFAVTGFKRGAALISIHFTWALIALIIAISFYSNLAASTYLNWFGGSAPLSSFLLILLLFFGLKILIYKVLAKVAQIHGPCPLNRFIAVAVAIGMTLGLSWLIANDLYNMDFFTYLISYQTIRFASVFVILALIIGGLSKTLVRLLNVQIGVDRPCPLLTAMQPVDRFLNAKNVHSATNSVIGIFMGLFQGWMVIIVGLIIINHYPNLATYTGFTEASFVLKTLKNSALEVQTFLSYYLSFIR